MTVLASRSRGTPEKYCKAIRRERYSHTFSIDSYGLMREEHLGDASIEGKLKELLSQVRAN